MILRKLTVATVVTAAAVSLSACDSKVGSAAKVGDSTISDSDVSDYVVAGFAQDPGTVLKSSVLSVLIQDRLFADAVRRTGGPATQAELDAAHSNAISVIAGGQVDESQFDTQFEQSLAKQGVHADFADVLVHTVELQIVFTQRAKIQSSDIPTALEALKIPVSVRGRYGSWDPASLGVNADEPNGVPSFVKLLGGTTGSDAPAPS